MKRKQKMNHGKICSISGITFPLNNENFYTNKNSSDGFHPYHKQFDNFRRTTGASTGQVRNLVNLIHNYS